MRFLEFVLWCGLSAGRSKVQSTAPSEGAAEEEGSLMNMSPRTRHRKKRVRSLTASNAPEWRPSLGSISEDHIAQPRERIDGQNQPEREVKTRNADSASRSKAQRRYYSDDHNHK